MKAKHIVALILFIILSDQVLKFHVKTNFLYGEQRMVLGNWFRLMFIENEGMAYGLKFGGDFGKLALTFFRLIAVFFGTFYLVKLSKKKHLLLKISSSLIYAGALGNLLDSLFYGIIFDKGMIFKDSSYEYLGIASLSNKGYSSFFHGNVVDMLYFPILRGHFPLWFPFYGGQSYEFFNMIFNVADASITTGIFIILLFQKRIFHNEIKIEKNSSPISVIQSYNS